MLIEADGLLHDSPWNDAHGRSKLAAQQANDRIKNEWAERVGYTLSEFRITILTGKLQSRRPFGLRVIGRHRANKWRINGNVRILIANQGETDLMEAIIFRGQKS